MLKNGTNLRRTQSLNVTAFQQNKTIPFIDFLESRRQEGIADEIEKWATASIKNVLGHKSRANRELTEYDLRLWIADMIRHGFSRQTRRRYYGKIHALHTNYAGNSPEAEQAFSSARNLIDSAENSMAYDNGNNLTALKRLAGDASATRPALAIHRQLFLYLFYNGGSTVDDAINATFADYGSANSQCDEIVESLKAPRRKYIFPLGQGRRTDKQIAKSLSVSIAAVLAQAGLRLSAPFSDDTAASLWISAAEACGIPTEDIRSAIGHVPEGHPYLSLIPRRPISDTTRTGILSRVADYVNDTAPRWYVMKMRQRVSPADINDRLTDTAPQLLGQMSTFYPCDEIIKLHGKKKTVAEAAVISSVLFFMMRGNKVDELFRNIGDLAWGYRTSNAPGSPYSVIPKWQMRNFQLCIGHFTPDVRVELTDISSDLGVGREVEIVGGKFAGYRGLIHDILSPNQTRTNKRVFRLDLTLNSSIRWTADIPEELIREV